VGFLASRRRGFANEIPASRIRYLETVSLDRLMILYSRIDRFREIFGSTYSKEYNRYACEELMAWYRLNVNQYA
jgi:hypothetical protein